MAGVAGRRVCVCVCVCVCVRIGRRVGGARVCVWGAERAVCWGGMSILRAESRATWRKPNSGIVTRVPHHYPSPTFHA